jgi:hypothetical protein
LTGASAAEQFQTKGGQEFQDGFAEVPQRGLILDPRLRVELRREDASSAMRRPLDHAPVHQEQQDRGAILQRQLGPELGASQVVLEVQTRIANGVFEESPTMFIIAVKAVVGQATVPVTSQKIHE